MMLQCWAYYLIVSWHNHLYILEFATIAAVYYLYFLILRRTGPMIFLVVLLFEMVLVDIVIIVYIVTIVVVNQIVADNFGMYSSLQHGLNIDC